MGRTSYSPLPVHLPVQLPAIKGHVILSSISNYCAAKVALQSKLFNFSDSSVSLLIWNLITLESAIWPQWHREDYNITYLLAYQRTAKLINETYLFHFRCTLLVVMDWVKCASIFLGSLPDMNYNNWDFYTAGSIHSTVKPVCNDHLYNKIYFLWFIQ